MLLTMTCYAYRPAMRQMNDVVVNRVESEERRMTDVVRIEMRNMATHFDAVGGRSHISVVFLPYMVVEPVGLPGDYSFWQRFDKSGGSGREDLAWLYLWHTTQSRALQVQLRSCP